MEKNPTLMLVVAAALQRDDGLWLMHRRPAGTHHAGLWEFPGGKVETGETPQDALVREVEEELGVMLARDGIRPVGFADGHAGSDGRPIVILLYTAPDWQGEAEAREGGLVCWFTQDEIADLDKPPLDVVLARSLFQKVGK